MTSEANRHTRTWTPIVIVAVALLVVAIGAYWFLTQGPGQQLLSAPGSTIIEFSGESDQSTDSFTVREGWAIHWESTGDAFAFAIDGDRDFGTVIDIDEPGNGVTSPTGSGTFRLEIVADGPWTMMVTQGD